MTRVALGRVRAGRLTARFLALDAERVLERAAIEWDASGRIVSLRRASGPVADVAILPGLVNAHAHLQIAALPGSASEPEQCFVPWVNRVMAARAGTTDTEHGLRASSAALHLLATGTTAVGEIDSTGESQAALARLPIAGRCYRELTGFHLDAPAARALVRQRWQPARAGLASGLSPHAPYSVSPDLLRAAAARAHWLAIHCAEVPEEQEFLHTGRGAFAELLRRLGRLPAGHRAPGCGAVRWLSRLGALRDSTLLVHCQELERGDVPLIAAAGASIVVCPGTIDWFRRRPPPVPRWQSAGINVGLGTDSLASNTALSMRAELTRAAAMWPELSPQQLFTMATAGGAGAIGRAVGTLRRGRRADLLVVPAGPSFAATLESFVHGRSPLESVVLAGCRHPGGSDR